ncbi:MAG TPA: methyltransferase, partial [Porticoccaceae bacterium]|nr:methyltransferase [Porticoccaceae bacterium]
MRCTLLLLITFLTGCQSAIESAVESSHRSADFRQRDTYRHPQATLSFFGIRDDMTVVEIWPG